MRKIVQTVYSQDANAHLPANYERHFLGMNFGLLCSLTQIF